MMQIPEAVIYTDKTDSGGASLLPLNPEFYENDIKIINDTYLFWTDNNDVPHICNLDTLKAGGYGAVTEEDFSLIKPQPLIPVTAVYGDDAGRSNNSLQGRLFQFMQQNITADYCYSAWSTRSKRIIPTSEATPSVGTDVTKNNNLVVSMDAGNDRVQTIVVGARFDNLDFNEIKRVDRSYILALPNASVNRGSPIIRGL